MIQVLGHCVYRICPNCLLNWKTGSADKEKHILYCEKLAIIAILTILYVSIVIIFVYYDWKQCTNIIDIINNENHNKIYYTKLFRRNSTYCNSMDVIFVIYIFFLLSTLALNIIFGIIYNYYRNYRNTKINKDKDNYMDKIIVHIPLYNEDFETIKSTIDSVCNLNYQLDNILLLIVVDGIITNSESNQTTDFTLLNQILQNDEYICECNQIQINYKDNKLKIYNGIYKTVNYSVIIKCGNEQETFKKGNRGKKDSALIIYETIYYMSETQRDDCYNQIIDKLQDGLAFKNHSIHNYDYMLIIDCDTDIEQNGLILLLEYIHTHNKCIAVCGQTIVKNTYENIITIVQSFEYFISHLLLKTYEHTLYNVFVLSGCFTLLKLKQDDKALINMNILNKYTKEANSLYQKNLLELGEDRYLTILIIQEYPNNNLAYISDAKCFTNVPNSFKILLDQRRRWTNSLITCLMLLGLEPPRQSIIKHIKMYLLIIMELFIIFILPLVIVIGFVNTIVSITVQGYSFLPVVITTIIILLNLIITILVARIDMILKFVPFFLFLPIFSILIPLYSIANLDNLKWGLTRDEHEIINIHTPTNESITNFNEI